MESSEQIERKRERDIKQRKDSIISFSVFEEIFVVCTAVVVYSACMPPIITNSFASVLLVLRIMKVAASLLTFFEAGRHERQRE
jgi:hypothetical protein